MLDAEAVACAWVQRQRFFQAVQHKGDGALANGVKTGLKVVFMGVCDVVDHKVLSKIDFATGIRGVGIRLHEGRGSGADGAVQQKVGSDNRQMVVQNILDVFGIPVEADIEGKVALVSRKTGISLSENISPPSMA